MGTDEPPEGTCLVCPLFSGHGGTCAVGPRKRRIAAIAADANISMKAQRGTRVKQTAKAGEDDDDVDDFGFTTSGEAEEEAEDPVWEKWFNESLDKLDEEKKKYTFPTMEKFLMESRLVTYTEAMVEKGWCDVKYIHEKVKGVEDFSKLESFPICKRGHLMKFLDFLLKLGPK